MVRVVGIACGIGALGVVGAGVPEKRILSATYGLHNALNDFMPITFSHPVQPSSIRSADVKVTLNTGDVVTPSGIVPNGFPADEKNEMQTFVARGKFGDGFKDTKWPARLEVVGNITFEDGSSAKGLVFDISDGQRYAALSPFLVQADVLPFSSEGESTAVLPLGAYPNHCQHLYGDQVTHRVRIVMNGGTTLEGGNSILPNQTDVFELLDGKGQRILSPIVGLADLGNKATGVVGKYTSDGDNFFDVCLDGSKGDVEGITTVRMPCETKLYLPSGRTPCVDNSIKVGKAVPRDAEFVV